MLAASSEPLSKNIIETAALLLADHSQKAIRSGIALAVKRGFITVTDGPRRAKLHSIAYPCSECGMPVLSKQQRHLSCPTELDELS